MPKFLGSGASALACLRMGRRCVGIDLDRKNVGAAAARLRSAGGGGALMEMRRQLRKLKRFEGRTRD